ncbi:hypothetical protein C6A84_21005 [Pseudomonas aeruginosa]|nr:hypothetical protein C6A84_21005 [Pseudomonas aeruginosa]
MELRQLWFVAMFVGHVQGLDRQVGIRLGRDCPADPPGNARWGRGTVRPGGVPAAPEWGMRCELWEAQ